MRYARAPVFWLVLTTAALCCGQSPTEGVEAITRVSQEVPLSFALAGTIAEIRVKPGDPVKPGDLLVRLDDRAEREQLAQLAAQAENDVRIRAAKAQLEQKKVDYNVLLELAKHGDASREEVDHARLDVTIAELSLELSEFQHEQDKRRHEEAAEQLERMRLVSPIAGEVHEVLVEQGEAVDSLEDVVRLINSEQLWIDVPVPVDLGRKLLMEWEQARSKKRPLRRTACVHFPLARQAGETQATTCTGEIIFVAKEADPASDTLLVRVQVPRPAGHPAGEHVRVQFPEPKPLPASRPATGPGPPQTAGAASRPNAAVSTRPTPAGHPVAPAVQKGPES